MAMAEIVVLGFGSGPGASSGRDNEALARLVDSQNADLIFVQRSLTPALRGLGIEPDFEVAGLVKESVRQMADSLQTRGLLGENIRVVAGQGHMRAVLDELRRLGVKATSVGTGDDSSTSDAAEMAATGGGSMWKLTGWLALTAAVAAGMSWLFFFGMLETLF